MQSFDKHKKFWFLCGITLMVAYIVKYLSPRLIAWLFQTNRVDFLNALLFQNGQHSLAFYQGRMEDLLFGPVFSLISGLLFFIICRKRLTNANVFVFMMAVLAYFILTRWEVLFYPPYGENMAGPLAPALWLKRHYFDFSGLLRQKTFAQGGPNVYVTSLFPWFMALLMKFSPSAKAFIFISHFICFSLAAAIVALLREILVKVFNRDIAVMGAVLLISLPVMQTMVEMINMEMPCVFFALWSVYHLINKRIGLAGMTAILSVLFKAPGGIACLTVFLVSILSLLDDEKQSIKVKNVLWGAGAMGIAVTKALTRKIIMGDQPANNKVEFLAGWSYMKGMAIFWIMLLLVLIGVSHFLFVWLQRRKGQRAPEEASRLAIVGIMLLMGVFWFLLYLNYSVMGYRYEVLLTPFFIFVLVYDLSLLFRNQKRFSMALFALTAFFLFCSHGLLYDRNVESSVYSYHKFERSLEYRNDLKMHMKAAKEIETNYSGHLIAAPFVMSHALGVPEFGYVQKQMDVMVYGMWMSYGNFKNFTGLKGMDLYNTIWLGFYESHFPIDLPYPMDPRDQFVKDVEEGDKRIALFKGGFAIEKMRVIVELARRGALREALRK